ncbi:chemotaxis protein CheR [Geotalea sp. SG265]|uniref:chemotaxis protein CheR n=1 Tax=Geotalea sp. SG265 TaxID=2922867 RepID=UPI001FAF0904|nr:chemotaxis protein CheR [Geotalea sp. SG265]
MQPPPLSFEPTLDRTVTEKRLAHLLVPGPLASHDLDRRILRLDRSFHRYAACLPHGLWAPGLVISNEMRALAELLLPLREILPLFDRLLARGMSCPPFPGASAIHHAHSWLDALQELERLATGANPAELLTTLLADEEKRRIFFFLNFLPKRYGGSFNRYPGQRDFLGNWLMQHKQRYKGKLRCLDAACGSGEGTYDLAALLVQCGFPPEDFLIHGATVEPFELFAAAHAFFPHDHERQRSYQRQVAPLFADNTCARINFRLEDIAHTPILDEPYLIVLCNGFLGGPFLHEQRGLAAAVTGLAGRLETGGILLAADRFHGGWKKKVPETLLAEVFRKAGLEVLETGEGLAGVKTG